MTNRMVTIPNELEVRYSDVYTAGVLDALENLASFNGSIQKSDGRAL